MNKIIQQLNGERATRTFPEFNPGDTVVVQVKVVEGDRERVQAYEGVVIAKKNRARRRRRARVPNLQPFDQRGQREAPGRGPPSQALLPA